MVNLDVTIFREKYPEFSLMSDSVIQDLFFESKLLIDYYGKFPPDVAEYILYKCTAHLAFIKRDASDGDSVGLGKISSASEGDVSASVEYQLEKAGQSFWISSIYGAELWELLRRFWGAFIV